MALWDRPDPLPPPPCVSQKSRGGMAEVLTCAFKRLFLQNFATVWGVAQVLTAVCCRLGTHMTQRKLGCKQTLPLPCSHSLLVQRSDNSLCKMAAGHGSFWELRWGGLTSRVLQPALTSALGYSRGFCYSSAVLLCWLVCICSEYKSGEFRQVQYEGRQHKLTISLESKRCSRGTA